MESILFKVSRTFLGRVKADRGLVLLLPEGVVGKQRDRGLKKVLEVQVREVLLLG